MIKDREWAGGVIESIDSHLWGVSPCRTHVYREAEPKGVSVYESDWDDNDEVGGW